MLEPELACSFGGPFKICMNRYLFKNHTRKLTSFPKCHLVKGKGMRFRFLPQLLSSAELSRNFGSTLNRKIPEVRGLAQKAGVGL